MYLYSFVGNYENTAHYVLVDLVVNILWVRKHQLGTY